MIFRKAGARPAAFTLVEMIIGMGAFGSFAAGLSIAWMALQANAVNAVAFSQRQSDQMRAIDYLKRDIRRASMVEIHDAGAPVAGANPGAELQITLPDYYADTREEDNAMGTNTANTPTLTGTDISYGGTMLVRYYIVGGAVIREEEGVPRAIADADGAFVFSFRWKADGDILAQIFYNQPMRGSASRTFRRQVDIAGRPRVDLLSASGAQ